MHHKKPAFSFETIILFLPVLTWCLFPAISCAETIHVPTDQPSIQQGINNALEHDTVLVAPGIYYENINFNGKNIVVASCFLTTQDSSYIGQTMM